MTGNGEVHDKNCYGCSPGNPIGLKIQFTVDDDRVTGEFTSTADHVGPPGILHGGVIGAVIDEAFSFLCRSLRNYDVRTVREEITFRNASPIGDKIRVEARVEGEKSRAVVATALVRSGQRTIAEAKGTLLKVRGAFSGTDGKEGVNNGET
jgi:acyl-coenzyme A thioesterase PaaI-like protein